MQYEEDSIKTYMIHIIVLYSSALCHCGCRWSLIVGSFFWRMRDCMLHSFLERVSHVANESTAGRQDRVVDEA